MNTNYSRLKYPALGKTDKITITGYKGLLPKYREAIDKINEAESDSLTCSDISPGMDAYDKEKLNEYAKELFALCLEKDLIFDYIRGGMFMLYIKMDYKWDYVYTYIYEEKYNKNIGKSMPIWELIEKVKQL